MCIYMCACVYIGLFEGQKETLDSLQLELWAFVNCLKQLLGTELWSFERAVYVLSCLAITPAQENRV